MKKILLTSLLGAALFSSMQTYAQTMVDYELLAATIERQTGYTPQDLSVTHTHAEYYYTVEFADGATGAPQSADCLGAGDSDSDGYPPVLEISCTITTPTR